MARGGRNRVAAGSNEIAWYPEGMSRPLPRINVDPRAAAGEDLDAGAVVTIDDRRVRIRRLPVA